MAKVIMNLRGAINIPQSIPNVDAKYGPYESVEEAWELLGPDEDDVACVGLTVGIQEDPDGPIVEYWFKDAAEDVTDLVPKGAELPEGVVIDDDYVHTDNNFTDEEKDKLENLENYDDTTIVATLDTKVDKIAGKGLSTEDYTAVEKQKLSDIEEEAQVNIIEEVQVNGVALTPTNKSVNVVIPAGDSTAKYNYTTNIEVGGVPVGTSIHDSDLLADLVKQMLVTTYYPTFTAPTASLTYSADTNVEVKSTIAAKTGTVGYNAGAITLQGVKQNNRGGAATKYYLSTSGADTEYSSSSTSSGTFNVSALTRSTKGSITITAKVDYAQGPQPKDSNGDDYSTPLAAGSVTATKTINFIQAFFYGKSASTTVSNFTGLTKSVTTKGNKTFKFTTNNEHMVFAYDSSYGNLTSILDPNSFEVISGWTKSTLTVDGFSYYVYVANSATTDTNASFTFKF